MIIWSRKKKEWNIKANANKDITQEEYKQRYEYIHQAKEEISRLESELEKYLAYMEKISSVSSVVPSPAPSGAPSSVRPAAPLVVPSPVPLAVLSPLPASSAASLTGRTVEMPYGHQDTMRRRILSQSQLPILPQFFQSVPIGNSFYNNRILSSQTGLPWVRAPHSGMYNNQTATLKPTLIKQSINDKTVYGYPMTEELYRTLPGVSPQQGRWRGGKKKVKYVKYKTKEILGKKRQIYRKKDKKSKKDYIKYKKDYITVNEYIKLAKKKKSKKN